VLYLVLILVITAFALLIAALTTAHTLWAWISVGISVLAAGVLVFDWLRGRRRVAATSAPRAERDDREDEAEYVEETAPERVERVEPVEPTTEIRPVEAIAEPVVAEAEPEPAPEADDEEPDEEATDASDLLVVSDLSVEVRVVDEHPRYHLAGCTWLSGKPTLPLPVSEARQLGFTPCARCGPDAVLAAKHRASRGAKQ
jgi:heme exporter protein D